MILILIEIFLITLPIFVFVMRKEFFLKKLTVIIWEILFIGVFIFVSSLVVMDIPYILEGGKQTQCEIGYISDRKKSTIAFLETTDGTKYWAETLDVLDRSVLKADSDDLATVEIRVLPHTRMLFRADVSYAGRTKNIYDAKEPGFACLLIVCLEGLLLWEVLKKYLK